MVFTYIFSVGIGTIKNLNSTEIIHNVIITDSFTTIPYAIISFIMFVGTIKNIYDEKNKKQKLISLIYLLIEGWLLIFLTEGITVNAVLIGDLSVSEDAHYRLNRYFELLPELILNVNLFLSSYKKNNYN